MASESLSSRLSWHYRWHGHKYGKTSPESRKNLWQRTNHSLVCFYFSYCISIQKLLGYYLEQEGSKVSFLLCLLLPTGQTQIGPTTQIAQDDSRSLFTELIFIFK